MLVFNNQQQCSFDEIASYGPKFYLNVKEMVAIYKFAGYSLDMIAEDLESLMAHQFIEYMDSESLSRVENFLGIIENKKLTLSERKTIVKASLKSPGKMSKSKIISIVNTFVESDCNVVLIDSKVKITITMTLKDNLAKYISYIRNLISKGIPAHLVLDFYGRYQGAFKTLVSGKNGIRFRMRFYPRYNLLQLQLDNSWVLDGNRNLNGYNSDNLIDFYPVKFRFQSKVTETVYQRKQVRVFMDVKKQNVFSAEKFGFETEVKENIRSIESIAFPSGVQERVTVGPIRIMNMNVLEKTWKLNGERLLDGGLSIL